MPEIGRFLESQASGPRHDPQRDEPVTPPSNPAGITARASDPPSASGTNRTLNIVLTLIQFGPVVILAVTWLAFSLASPLFLTADNIRNLVNQSSVVAVLALAALVVILIGEIDLSIATNAGLATVVGAWLYDVHHFPGWSILPLMLASATAAGIVNGILIVVLNFGNSLIVTLGGLYILLSLSYVLGGGAPVPGMPGSITGLANGSILGIPGPAVVVVVSGLTLAFMFRETLWGRWMHALGGNKVAAERMGMPVRSLRVSAFIIGGIFSGIAAVLLAGRANAGFPDSGQTVLLAIASVVIGGASLTGGRGTVVGSLVGALILASITNGLGLLSVDPNYVPLAVGGILVAAVGLEQVRLKLEQRIRLQQARLLAGDV